jgi:hypothetical protein
MANNLKKILRTAYFLDNLFAFNLQPKSIHEYFRHFTYNYSIFNDKENQFNDK